MIVAKYVPAATIASVLSGLDSRPGAVRVDAATNFVMVQGTATERKEAIDAAEMVDVDWLKSKSVAILPVANSSPDTIIGELNRILDTGEGGLSQNVVQLQPMTRLNAVLAVSRRRDALDQVTKWVARLDRVDPNSAIKIYRLQYAKAKNVAALINYMFASSHQSPRRQADNECFGAAARNAGRTPPGTSPERRPRAIPMPERCRQIPVANIDGSADMNTGACGQSKCLRTSQGRLPAILKIVRNGAVGRFLVVGYCRRLGSSRGRRSEQQLAFHQGERRAIQSGRTCHPPDGSRPHSGQHRSDHR